MHRMIRGKYDSLYKREFNEVTGKFTRRLPCSMPAGSVVVLQQYNTSVISPGKPGKPWLTNNQSFAIITS